MGGCAWRGGRCLAKSGGGRLELKGGIIGGFLGGGAALPRTCLAVAIRTVLKTRDGGVLYRTELHHTFVLMGVLTQKHFPSILHCKRSRAQ